MSDPAPAAADQGWEVRLKTWKVVCSPEGGKVTTIEVCRADEARSKLDAAIAREERTEEARRVYEKECDWLEGKLDAAIAERDEARQQIRDLRLADEDRKADQGVILREAARAESAEAEVKRLKERLGE